MTSSTEWAFTVKFLGKDNVSKLPSDYDYIFNDWAKYDCHKVLAYCEQDKMGAPHWHGIVTIPKNLYRKKLEKQGVHLKLCPITDREGWIKYCRKDLTKFNLPIFKRDYPNMFDPDRVQKKPVFVPDFVSAKKYFKEPKPVLKKSQVKVKCLFTITIN